MTREGETQIRHWGGTKFDVAQHPSVTAMDYQQICSLRTSMGFTQQRFAEILSVSPRTVQNWESDRSQPTGFVQAVLYSMRVRHSLEGSEFVDGLNERFVRIVYGLGPICLLAYLFNTKRERQ